MVQSNLVLPGPAGGAGTALPVPRELSSFNTPPSGSPPSTVSVPSPTPPAPSSPQAPPGTPETPMEIFLSKRYRTLNLAPTGPLTPEQKQMQEQLRLQKKVETFFSEGCLVRSSLMGVGGGVLGVLFGAFFFTMKPVDVDTTRPFREQFKQQYKTFLPDVARSSKSFAKLGFIYSLVECFIQRERAVHDINNAVYAGCVTGAALAYSGKVSRHFVKDGFEAQNSLALVLSGSNAYGTRSLTRLLLNRGITAAHYTSQVTFCSKTLEGNVFTHLLRLSLVASHGS
ncbi:mitochondrial import inner membrane translocase subunit tim17 domain-contraining [Cystoisospora suis]|uniref:Mitochondrial import inner membrane translocase subunit TIM22 n=1 Tax=Cystoisospora suis TaxID=483139 RepID=A0A2C6KWN4_9APIC|nr:mitochondrial import inner membrane translocase subunit tim17 domain-contraining [Cystoisospora suis]